MRTSVPPAGHRRGGGGLELRVCPVIVSRCQVEHAEHSLCTALPMIPSAPGWIKGGRGASLLYTPESEL